MKSGSESIGSKNLPARPSSPTREKHGGNADQRFVRWTHVRNETEFLRERCLVHLSVRSEAAAHVADFVVVSGSSIYLVKPLNNDAQVHLLNVVGEEAQFLGNAVAVEHRYIGSFVAALVEDGFTVAGER